MGVSTGWKRPHRNSPSMGRRASTRRDGDLMEIWIHQTIALLSPVCPSTSPDYILESLYKQIA